MRARNAPALRALIEPLAAQQDTDECVARMRAEGTPIGKVNEHDDVITDPQVLHSQSLAEVDHGELGRVRLARAAARFGSGPRPQPEPAPALGEHGHDVLRDLGYDETRIGSLAACGAVSLGGRPSS
jgi:crotonobetainyl-CoA:carnitine CoA-transferase CaiB-like acyl-CoA transferase